MIVKEKTTGIILFPIFFVVGWIIGLLPSKFNAIADHCTYLNVRHVLSNTPVLKIADDYISSNQFMIDILHYNLDIEIFPKDKRIKGTAVITGKVLQSQLDRIDINFYENLEIKELTLNNVFVKFKNEKKRLSIFSEGTKLDTFILKISYEGKPKRAGFSAFSFGEINGNSVVYNLNEPSFASTWFPCNDIPSDKALLDIKITNDSSKTSISNGVLVSKEIHGDRKTYHWKTYYPLSTYLMCIYSANYLEFHDKYISSSGDTLPIQYYVLPEHFEEAKIDFKNTPKMIDYFSKTFGEYPFIKEKYGIAEFLWQMGAMEHQTITGIGSNFVSGKNFFEDIYVHELAHHWWGNAVGPATWKDIWLNEGFATYSEALYAESKAGKDALKSSMISKFSDEFSNTMYDPGQNLFSTTVYDKGAWVLHMLRWELGDSTFFDILRTYFELYKYKSASTNEFIQVCETVSKKDLNRFFDQWVFTGTENIQLEYEWFAKKQVDDKYLVVINIEQKTEKYPVFEFKLEIMIEHDYEKSISRVFNINQREKRIEIILDKMPNQLILDPNNWLLANIKDMNSYEN